MAVARSEDRGGERQTRLLLGGSATGVAAGIGLAVLDLPALAQILTVASLLALIYSVHSFGRVGADASDRSARRRGRSRPRD